MTATAFAGAIKACALDPLYCYGTLQDKLNQTFSDYLPDNDGWKQCNKRAYLQISEADGSVKYNASDPLMPCPLTPVINLDLYEPAYITKPGVISTFKSRADLINVALGSAFLVPLSSHTECSSEVRPGVFAVDGGYVNPTPCPPGGGKCLVVSTYRAGVYRIRVRQTHTHSVLG